MNSVATLLSDSWEVQLHAISLTKMRLQKKKSITVANSVLCPEGSLVCKDKTTIEIMLLLTHPCLPICPAPDHMRRMNSTIAGPRTSQMGSITNELFTASKSCDMLWSLLPGFVEIIGKPTFDAGDAMRTPSTVHEPCHMKSRKPEERQGVKEGRRDFEFKT